MGRRDRRYLERAERALYEALASGDERALAAATARLDGWGHLPAPWGPGEEPRDEADRRMRDRLLAMARTRSPLSPRPAVPAESTWMFAGPE
jgi:hypothetical protein